MAAAVGFVLVVALFPNKEAELATYAAVAVGGGDPD